MKGKINGISLFSGYGGLDMALEEFVRTILYCEIEQYAKGVLLSAMDDQVIDFAPIWNNVATLDGRKFRGLVDAIFGGVPCQGFSVAGLGKGLEDERSGLFREVFRLVEEINPTFLFFENVPAIRSRGAEVIQENLARLGYDTRWTTLSASEVGANHKRERWFCIAAHTDRVQLRDELWWSIRTKWENKTVAQSNGQSKYVADSEHIGRQGQLLFPTLFHENSGETPVERSEQASESCELSNDPGNIPDTNCSRWKWKDTLQPKEWIEDLELARSNNQVPNSDSIDANDERFGASPFCWEQWQSPILQGPEWWELEPHVGRVAHGIAFRAHRLKALGNGVVPLQGKTAFRILMGIN